MVSRRFVVLFMVLAMVLLAVAGAYNMLNRPAGEVSFTLTAEEFGYNQSNGAPTLRVKVGEKVTITIVNNGAETHETMVVTKETLALALDPTVAYGGEEGLDKALGHHIEPVFQGAATDEAEPGETSSMTFMANQPGNYVYGCFTDEPGIILHAFRGMWGEFRVES